MISETKKNILQNPSSAVRFLGCLEHTALLCCIHIFLIMVSGRCKGHGNILCIVDLGSFSIRRSHKKVHFLFNSNLISFNEQTFVDKWLKCYNVI